MFCDGLANMVTGSSVPKAEAGIEFVPMSKSSVTLQWLAALAGSSMTDLTAMSCVPKNSVQLASLAPVCMNRTTSGASGKLLAGATPVFRTLRYGFPLPSIPVSTPAFGVAEGTINDLTS